MPKPSGVIKPKDLPVHHGGSAEGMTVQAGAKESKPAAVAGPTAPPSKYPKNVAIVFTVYHVIFAVVITIWNFHPYIIKPSGLGYFVYILELPSAIIVGILGGEQSGISPEILYSGAFIINTVFYGFFGYLIGYVLLTYGWDKEVNRLCKLETEVYEETPGV
mgnify:FL=1